MSDDYDDPDDVFEEIPDETDHIQDEVESIIISDTQDPIQPAPSLLPQQYYAAGGIQNLSQPSALPTTNQSPRAHGSGSQATPDPGAIGHPQTSARAGVGEFSIVPHGEDVARDSSSVAGAWQPLGSSSMQTRETPAQTVSAASDEYDDDFKSTLDESRISSRVPPKVPALTPSQMQSAAALAHEETNSDRPQEIPASSAAPQEPSSDGLQKSKQQTSNPELHSPSAGGDSMTSTPVAITAAQRPQLQEQPTTPRCVDSPARKGPIRAATLRQEPTPRSEVAQSSSRPSSVRAHRQQPDATAARGPATASPPRSACTSRTPRSSRRSLRSSEADESTGRSSSRQPLTRDEQIQQLRQLLSLVTRAISAISLEIMNISSDIRNLPPAPGVGVLPMADQARHIPTIRFDPPTSRGAALKPEDEKEDDLEIDPKEYVVKRLVQAGDDPKDPRSLRTALRILLSKQHSLQAKEKAIRARLKALEEGSDASDGGSQGRAEPFGNPVLVKLPPWGSPSAAQTTYSPAPALEEPSERLEEILKTRVAKANLTRGAHMSMADLAREILQERAARHAAESARKVEEWEAEARSRIRAEMEAKREEEERKKAEAEAEARAREARREESLREFEERHKHDAEKLKKRAEEEERKKREARERTRKQIAARRAALGLPPKLPPQPRPQSAATPSAIRSSSGEREAAAVAAPAAAATTSRPSKPVEKKPTVEGDPLVVGLWAIQKRLAETAATLRQPSCIPHGSQASTPATSEMPSSGGASETARQSLLDLRTALGREGELLYATALHGSHSVDQTIASNMIASGIHDGAGSNFTRVISRELRNAAVDLAHVRELLFPSRSADQAAPGASGASDPTLFPAALAQLRRKMHVLEQLRRAQLAEQAGRALERQARPATATGLSSNPSIMKARPTSKKASKSSSGKQWWLEEN